MRIAIAGRVVALTEEISQASTQLHGLVAQAAPRTTALLGVSTEHAGQLLATAGGVQGGYVPRRPSPPCAPPVRYPPAVAKSTATASTPQVIEPPTAPRT
jgi:hypothetical protein